MWHLSLNTRKKSLRLHWIQVWGSNQAQFASSADMHLHEKFHHPTLVLAVANKLSPVKQAGRRTERQKDTQAIL